MERGKQSKSRLLLFSIIYIDLRLKVKILVSLYIIYYQIKNVSNKEIEMYKNLIYNKYVNIII